MPAQQFQFTKAALAALRPPASGRAYYQDREQPALRAYLTAGGVITFYAQKKVEGRTLKPVIGRWPDIPIALARRRAAELRTELALGRDPVAEKRTRAHARCVQRRLRFGALLEEYLDASVRGRLGRGKPLAASTLARYRSIARTYLRDWRDTPLAAITPAMCARRFEEITRRSPSSANTALQTVGVVFDYARRNYDEAPGDNPVKRGVPAWNPVGSRTRVLHPDDLSRWLAAVDQLGPTPRALLRSLLYTGCRIGDLGQLRVANLSLAARTYHLAKTKTGVEATLPLPAVLVPVLEEQLSRARSGWVFPRPRAERPMTRAQREFDRVARWAQVEVTAHTLRHTFLTTAETVGISDYRRKRLALHATSDITHGYTHLEVEALREDIEKIAAFYQKAAQAQSSSKS